MHTLVVEPFLHIYEDHFFNPIRNTTLRAKDPAFRSLKSVIAQPWKIRALLEKKRAALVEDGWLVRDQPDLATRFYLRYVSLEAHSRCNQGCYFCPVSTDPRDSESMPMELYGSIAQQLAEYRHTIEAVFMHNYNEPTIDKRLVEQVSVLKSHSLPIAINTNASGLSPKRVDQILELGGIDYMSVNFSTMDAERYQRDRQSNQLDIIIRNLDYLKALPLATIMDMAVLGRGDATHRRDFEEISAYFKDSRFNVRYFVTNDRSGNLDNGLKTKTVADNLCGCDHMGSRPIQHIHITARGLCVLCCQDYFEKHVIGDLAQERLEDVLTGDKISELRRWIYGLDEAPVDFICRRCTFAKTS